MARLDIYQNGSPRFEVRLPEAGALVLGRGPLCGLVLPDPQVSREHARITVESGGHVLQDASANGTRLNGRDLEGPAALSDEDVIEIGSYRIFYRVRSAAAQAHPTVRRRAEPTRILKVEGLQVHSERAWLEWKGQRHELSARRLTLGSGEQAGLHLSDEFVSRVHAAVFPAGKAWHVEDLGSTNGTLVGGRKVDRAELKDGDEIALGRARIVFRAKKKKEKLSASKATGLGALLGSTRVMRALYAQAARVAASQVPVLIGGESGTGKELLAAAIHDLSPRAGRPFVPVHCGAIPESLAESELFGHEKGAFTGAVQKRDGLFAEADGGTIFLDEIGELPLPLQVKLLRVLESGEVRPVGGSGTREVDVRVVAATHRDLSQMVREKKFREDLYFRLAVVTLQIPPLRERLGDIPQIAASLLPAGRRLSKEALSKLQKGRWQGNVRELKNTIERAAILTEGAEIGPDAVFFDALRGPPSGGFFDRHPELKGKSLEEIEILLVTEALKGAGGVQAEAAKTLGLAKSSLAGRVARYGLRHLVKGGTGEP